jgi:hypothetical protein
MYALDPVRDDTAMPATDDPSTPTLVNDPAHVWRAALALLTERERAVLTLRHGAFGGERLTFADVSSKLRITRQRAHQLHHRAIEVLRHRDETRELAEKLAAGAAPVERDVKGEPEPNTVIAVVDPAPTKRALTIAMKRVAEADRELAQAIEACRDHGHEALGAALQSARTVIGVHMRELVEVPVLAARATERVSTALSVDREDDDHDRRIRILRQTGGKEARPARDPSIPKRGRGRPVDPARLEMLRRVERGELGHAKAAAELGLTRSRWTGWVAYQTKNASGQSVAAVASEVVSPPRPRVDPTEIARRVAVLDRVKSGELTNDQAAAEVGMRRWKWETWKSTYRKGQSSKAAARSAAAASATPDTSPSGADRPHGLDALDRPEVVSRTPMEIARVKNEPSLDADDDAVEQRKRRDGRPFNVAENERRAALLARLVAGEITNAEAAAELGIKTSAWSSWKVLHRKRMAAAEAPGGADRSPERTSVRRGRGRPENVQETARRAAALERVQAGELTNAEAATELGINLGTWGAWKSGYVKRAGVIPAPIARASVEPTSISTGKRGRGRPVDPTRLAMLERVQRGELGHDEAAAELGIKLTAWSSWMTYHSKRQGHPAVAPRTRAHPNLGRFEDLESFGRELKERMRALIELVERWLG